MWWSHDFELSFQFHPKFIVQHRSRSGVLSQMHCELEQRTVEVEDWVVHFSTFALQNFSFRPMAQTKTLTKGFMKRSCYKSPEKNKDWCLWFWMHLYEWSVKLDLLSQFKAFVSVQSAGSAVALLSSDGDFVERMTTKSEGCDMRMRSRSLRWTLTPMRFPKADLVWITTRVGCA